MTSFPQNQEITDFIERSLREDLGSGDHSSLACISAEAKGKARLIVKEDGILAGVPLAQYILIHLDPSAEFSKVLPDGSPVRAGDQGFVVEARVQAILAAERLMLNCMQRMSGIATTTAKLVSMISHTRAKLLDTRKTTPGLRFLEKWAVAAGGGVNHRFGLYDMIMLKDNHIDYAGGITPALQAVHRYLQEKNLNLPVEVETRNLDEVKELLKCGGADRVMFDNFTPDEIRKALKLTDGIIETEASGGIQSGNLVEYAETGVDYISMGALTHSVKSLDISLKQFS